MYIKKRTLQTLANQLALVEDWAWRSSNDANTLLNYLILNVDTEELINDEKAGRIFDLQRNLEKLLAELNALNIGGNEAS